MNDINKKITLGKFVFSYAGIITILATAGMTMIVHYAISSIKDTVMGIIITWLLPLAFYFVTAFSAIHTYNKRCNSNKPPQTKQ